MLSLSSLSKFPSKSFLSLILDVFLILIDDWDDPWMKRFVLETSKEMASEVSRV